MEFSRKTVKEEGLLTEIVNNIIKDVQKITQNKVQLSNDSYVNIRLH